MRPPLRLRRKDPQGLGWLEAEPCVVPRIAEERYGGSVQRIGGGQDRVHQGMTEASTLVSGVHPKRAQPDAGLAVDACAAADDVSDHVLGRLGNDRQAGQDVTVCSEPVDQGGLGRNGHTRAGEGRIMQSEDRGRVTG